MCQVMEIQRPVFLKLWQRNTAAISNKYMAVISIKYVAVISYKCRAVRSIKYVAFIFETYVPVLSNRRRTKNINCFMGQFSTIFEPQLLILRSKSCSYFSLRNLFVFQLIWLLIILNGSNKIKVKYVTFEPNMQFWWPLIFRITKTFLI